MWEGPRASEHRTEKEEASQRPEDLETPGRCHMRSIRFCSIDGATPTAGRVNLQSVEAVST